jgi:stearoyl-CoA desaturase (delta-9 desaturase)
MTLQEFESKVRNEKLEWIALSGFVIDVTEFKDDHPGGAKMLLSMRGRDATAAFEGGMNNHSNSARNLAGMYRVAKLVQRDTPKYLEDK